MTRFWTVTTHQTGVPREVQVFLYPTLKEMREAAKEWADHMETGESFSNAAGVCHGFTKTHVDADGSETPQALAAIIRLCSKRLSPEIVCHEVAHAAQHLYRLDLVPDDNVPASTHWTAANEPFATLMGDLFHAVWITVTDGVA